MDDTSYPPGYRQDIYTYTGDLTPEIRAEALEIMPRKVAATRYKNTPLLEPLNPIPQQILLPYHFPLFQAIHDRVLDRQDAQGFERIELQEGIHSFLRDNEFENDLIIGNFTATDRTAKIKYVTQVPYTLTECAREYIRICEFSAGSHLKPTYNKIKDVNRKHPTMYFSGYANGELAYIDLRAAYFQILWPTTIDMQYEPDLQEIVQEGNIGYVHADQFMKCKKVRQIIHTLYNYRYMKTWDHEKKIVVRRKPPSEIYRPYNMSFIYDMMNAIAQDINANFTLYQWLTDAAIVPYSQAESVREFLFQEWFLDSRLEAFGDGISNQMNMYKVGDKRTAHFDPDKKGRPHSSFKPANIDYLKSYRMACINGEIPIIKSKRTQRVLGVAKHVAKEIQIPDLNYYHRLSKTDETDAIPMTEIPVIHYRKSK